MGKEFLSLPDGHFNIWFPGNSCYSPSKIKANVGSNYISNFKDAIYKTKTYSSKQTILIAISHFPHYEDRGWDGFSKTLKKLKKYQNIIIDLRGNSGGDSRRGLDLARFLLNPTIEHNKKEIVRKNTPEAWTIFRNGILRKKIWKDANNLSTNHLDEYLKEIDENRKKSLTSNKIFLNRRFKSPSLEKINFEGNIYVLTDKECGSSCEHTIEALKFHPMTKVVGQNTSGAVHYGQIGIIRLPSSGVYIQLATQYFKLFEEGYFDKIGYTPDIIVPAGKDALPFILKKIR